jgi:hypothetical protein
VRESRSRHHSIPGVPVSYRPLFFSLHVRVFFFTSHVNKSIFGLDNKQSSIVVHVSQFGVRDPLPVQIAATRQSFSLVRHRGRARHVVLPPFVYDHPVREEESS